jgi:hypothetical protein
MRAEQGVEPLTGAGFLPRRDAGRVQRDLFCGLHNS